MLSLLFIKRPKLSAVISIALFLAGAICALRLPIAEYPTVVPPLYVFFRRLAGVKG